MNESDKPTTQNEIQENQFRRAVLVRALDLVDSSQNVQEWVGATFLMPSTESKPHIDQMKSRLRALLESGKYQYIPAKGVFVGGVSLVSRVEQMNVDAEPRHLDTAWDNGFVCGVQDALSWIGILATKWSSHSPEVCALETLAAVEGIPTSRQLNHMRPETLVGCRVTSGEPKYYNSQINPNLFQYGEVNSIYKSSSDLFERVCDDVVSASKLVTEAKAGYREGVEIAFLHYVAIGNESVQFDPFERISNAYANARRGSGVR